VCITADTYRLRYWIGIAAAGSMVLRFRLDERERLRDTDRRAVASRSRLVERSFSMSPSRHAKEVSGAIVLVVLPGKEGDV